MPTYRVPRHRLRIGAKIALAFVLLTLIGGAVAGCGELAEAEWTSIGRVCDFNAKCQEEFECRSMDGTIEIYLPYGSFSTGNEGWEWKEDVGERCGEPPA